MKTRLFAAIAASLATLAVAGSASALTYTSQLEYRDGLVGPQTPYGTVTIDEVDAKTVKFTVTLADPASLFVNTGGPHDPFLFNLPVAANMTVTKTGSQDFFYAGDGSYNSTPFGTFTDKIGCCQVWVPPTKKVPGHYADGNGQANGDAPPLVFTAFNENGLTFAGVGATFDPVTGRLLQPGTGNHFVSNAGGFWFAADIYDGKTRQTYNVAARDAFRPVTTTDAVPEPASWALMILGFGSAGAMLRRRRLVAVAA
ncbi:MAG: PEP-CTERM sorting domain-containing protein [Caulobacterales bacterium]|nr:PEP-CTERM sorting domain-containing protein [Caulobacterales bacterium]